MQNCAITKLCMLVGELYFITLTQCVYTDKCEAGYTYIQKQCSKNQNFTLTSQHEQDRTKERLIGKMKPE